MSVKTISLLLLLLKIYAVVGFGYFLILLFQVDKGLTVRGGIDVQNVLSQALMWPKDLFIFLMGAKR